MSIDMIKLVFERAAVKGAAWQVLVALAEHASADGTGSYPSVQTIADETNLSHSAVRAALRGLRRAHYIEHTGWARHGTVNWTLTPDRWPPTPPPLSERGVPVDRSRRIVAPSDAGTDTTDRDTDRRNEESPMSDRRAPKPSVQPPANRQPNQNDNVSLRSPSVEPVGLDEARFVRIYLKDCSDQPAARAAVAAAVAAGCRSDLTVIDHIDQHAPIEISDVLDHRPLKRRAA